VKFLSASRAFRLLTVPTGPALMALYAMSPDHFGPDVGYTRRFLYSLLDRHLRSLAMRLILRFTLVYFGFFVSN